MAEKRGGGERGGGGGVSVFFFNDTATTEIYTLSLHDALPIYCKPVDILKQLVLLSSMTAPRCRAITSCGVPCTVSEHKVLKP